MATTTCDPEVEALYPRLTRFYGLSPRDLAALDRPILRAYAEQLPELTAEEALRALEVSVYPHLEEDAQRDLVKHWQRLLHVVTDTVERPESGQLPDAGKLAGIGIKLVATPGEGR